MLKKILGFFFLGPLWRLTLLFKPPIPQFIAIGILTIIIDFYTYVASALSFPLLGGQAQLLLLPKGLGFIAGTSFFYLAKKIGPSRKVKYVLKDFQLLAVVYLTTLVINMAINETINMFLKGEDEIFFLAFALALATSYVLNFIGMKRYVFEVDSSGAKMVGI